MSETLYIAKSSLGGKFLMQNNMAMQGACILAAPKYLQRLYVHTCDEINAIYIRLYSVSRNNCLKLAVRVFLT